MLQISVDELVHVPSVAQVSASAPSSQRLRDTRDADVDESRCRRTPDALAIGGLLLLVAALMWSRFWHRPGLGDWDIMNFYLPWYTHLGEALRSFDVPGWNPYIFSGAPFAGNPQSGWTYLPAMVSFSVLPPITGYKLFFAFHLALGGLGAYGLARLLTFGALGSFAAGVAFTFGQNVGATRCCTNHLQLVVWIPIGMIGIELMLRSTTMSQRLAALSLSGFAASQMIAGWVGQGAYNGLLILGSYLVWRSLFPCRTTAPWQVRGVRLLRDGAVIFGVGLGLSAAGLLPRLDAIGRTFLGTDDYQGATFAPDRGWDWPHVFNVLIEFRLYWHPYYLGGAAMVCTVVALVTGRLNRVVGYFVGLVLVLIILPARPTPLHELFYLLPRFRGLHLHDPGRVLAVLPIGIAILVAATVEATTRPLRRPSVRSLFVALLALWTGLVALDLLQPWSIAPITWISAAGASLVLLMWGVESRAGTQNAVLRRSGSTTRIVPAALVLLILADPAGRVVADDLGQHHGDANLEAAVTESAAATDPGGAGEFLQGKQAQGELFRYFGYLSPEGPAWQGHEVFMRSDVLPLLANNRAMRLGLYDIQGYDPAQIERYRAYFEALNGLERDYHEALIYSTGISSPLLDLLNVRYILVPAAIPADREDLQALVSTYPEVFRNEQVRVLENENALPRAWLVHDARQVSEEQALELLASDAFDPRQTVLLQASLPLVQPAPTGEYESVTISEYTADQVRLTVNASSAGVVVLGDAYDPGWKVYVNGKRSDLYVANMAFRGVAVSAGVQEIEFRYEPSLLHIGLAISGFTALLMLGIVGFYFWGMLRRRRGTSTANEIRLSRRPFDLLGIEQRAIRRR
jgi:hypothetical protein